MFVQKVYNLTTMPKGERYEDRYGAYMKIFQDIAASPDEVIVKSPPWSWVPLLYHLNVRWHEPQQIFTHCKVVRDAWPNSATPDRTLIEVLCSFRPECADALWKCDMQWELHDNRKCDYHEPETFIVTTNGAFHRREVRRYLEALHVYKPSKKKVVIVPCAADKPYPSTLHKAILEILPDDYYMMNATGVLGLVPQDWWDIMPHYDSGIPNRWRLFEIACEYFAKHKHEDIVVYSDFYAKALQVAFHHIGEKNVRFVLPPVFYYDYEDLLSERWMNKLKKCLTGSSL